MKYSFHCVIIIILASVSCNQSLKTKHDIYTELGLLPKLENLSPEKETGVLHTLRRYIKWHIIEETLLKKFQTRVELLQIQHDWIKRFSFKNKVKRRNLLQRVLNVLLYIQRDLGNNVDPYFTDLDLIRNRSSKNKWVGNEDLLFSITGIHHLQQVYFTAASQISKGLNFDSNFGGYLNQLEMVLQALYSLTKNRFVTAINWLQEATDFKNKILPSDLLHLVFSIGIQTHNLKHLIRSTTTEMYTNIRTDDVEDVYQVPILNGQLPSEQYSNRRVHFSKFWDTDLNTRFSTLCSGHNLQTSKVLSKLQCYIDNRKDPYLYINPLKVEQLSVKPLILQFYEIMSNKTIESVVREVGPHVTPLKLWFDDNNFAYGSFPYHVTNSGNMGINFANVSKSTQKLTKIMSGLTIWNGPNHNRYREHVYGRHLNMHNDGADITSKLQGRLKIPDDSDMIATMLFYLKVPRLGGCTAFVHTGVCSSEVAGSATFWYNMYKNGSYTTELRHGSCPVYHGEKIALTLFIKHNANWNKRICSKDQFDNSI